MKRPNILALIPARVGSKRLPGKNLRLLQGLPLIAWTIRAASKTRLFTDVLVSTDDAAIAAIAIENGASAPWLRPSEISTDTATSIDVVLHALAAYEAAGGVADSLMLLQPTSPFRSAESMRRAVELHVESDRAPVVSVSPAQAHPAWCFRVEGESRLRGYADGDWLLARSQDLPPAYQLNGSIYIASVQDLRNERSFFCPHTRALVLERAEESIDIDDAWDWRIAECIAADLLPPPASD